MTTPEQDWLHRAVELAVENVAGGRGPFAALVVRDGVELGRGANRVVPDRDPTAHAEVVAVRDACRRIGDHRLTGCLLVSSCEPCPLCLAAALWARVDRVVYAAARLDAARAGFDDAAFHELFAAPRERWEVPVDQLPTPGAVIPFDAWVRRAERVSR